MQGRELRTAILLLLDERRHTDPSRTVDDTEIVETLGALLEDVRRQLDILEARDYTNEANTFGGHSAYVSAEGMAIAEELREATETEQSSQRPIGFD